jgi:glycine/D-amino acid oxidase-like deaminating enzyme
MPGKAAAGASGTANLPPGAPPGAPEVETFVTAESCDGLPIVGALPGQPRVHVCTGFGALGPTYGPAAAHHLADALLGLRPLPLPSTFAPHRLR